MRERGEGETWWWTLASEEAGRRRVKVLVTGSRGWTDPGVVHERITRLPDDTLVITGRARGVDSFARAAALDCGLWVLDVPVEDEHWRRYGRAAGQLRNRVMLDLLTPDGGDFVLAFHDGVSSGTAGTIDEARHRGLEVEVHTP
jgi:hypothetical protein